MQCISRSDIVNGKLPFKSAEDGHRKRGDRESSKLNPKREDVWYDTESFMFDHVVEVLSSLEEGKLHDEIWGKIVLMEEGCRLAKAYLRKSSVIVDGGDEEFDGQTLGYNHFRSSRSDSNEFRAKIGEGVILMMDAHGNLKAMARGSAPVYVQGCKDGRQSCAADNLIRVQGKLNQVNADGKDCVYKVFEMKKFKRALQTLERDGNEAKMKQRNLLLRTCVRIALVKDGNSSDPNRTPCWLAVVNIVALEMLKEQIQLLGSVVPPTPIAPLIPSSYAPTDLAQLLVAAMQQSPQVASNFGISPFASLANSLPVVPPTSTAVQSTVNSHGKMALSRRTSRRPLPPQSTLSSDDESEGENELERNSRFSDGTASKLSDSISSASDRSAQLVLQNSHFRPSPDFTPKKAHRPRLDQFVAQFGGHSDVASSGYDSPRDLFDSGSWSSGADTRCSQSDESPPSTQIEVSSTEHDAIHNAEVTTVPDYSIYSWVNKTVPVNDNSPLPSPPPHALISPSNSFNQPFSVQLKSHQFAGQSVARQKSLTSTQCCLRGIGTGPLMSQEPKSKTKPTANRPNSRLHCWLSRERSFDTTTTQSPESTSWWRDAMRSPISRTESPDFGNFDRILMSTDRPSAPPHASPVRPTARKPLPPRHINASDSRITRTTSSSANGRSVSAYPRNIREPNASRSRSPSTQLSKLLQRLHPHQSSRLSDCELATSWRRQF